MSKPAPATKLRPQSLWVVRLLSLLEGQSQAFVESTVLELINLGYLRVHEGKGTDGEDEIERIITSRWGEIKSDGYISRRLFDCVEKLARWDVRVVVTPRDGVAWAIACCNLEHAGECAFLTDFDTEWEDEEILDSIYEGFLKLRSLKELVSWFESIEGDPDVGALLAEATN